MDPASVKIVVSDNAFSIAFHGKELAIFTVDSEDVLNLCLPDVDGLMLHDDAEGMEYSRISIDVADVSNQVLVPVATLPRNDNAKVRPVRVVEANEEPAAPPVRAKIRHTTTRGESPLEEYQRNTIITMIAESWHSDPDQTTHDTAKESHRIGEEVFGSDDAHNTMRVAGVRAALTRGAYDVTLDHLVSLIGSVDHERSIARAVR